MELIKNKKNIVVSSKIGNYHSRINKIMNATQLNQPNMIVASKDNTIEKATK